MKPSHVLVPLDGSPLARDALEYALEVHGGRITVLNVVTSIDTGMSEGSIVEADEERRDEARRRAENLVEEAKREAGAEDADVNVVTETGTPAETVLERVEKTDVDHVVMGSHGGERSDMVSRLLGTVSTKVVTEAPVSVTVIR
ncbi:MAG: universal stress protein [Halobacteriales archaeon]|nr:universal stress protein [Halobacteriales archaeon]